MVSLYYPLGGKIMKIKWIVLMMAVLALCSGCMAPNAYETMNDEYLQVSLPEAGELSVLLPVEAAALTMESDSGKVYVCDGYSVALHTCVSGDLDATLRTITGYDRVSLPLMERMDEQMKRYECVWTAAGEGGDQVGRTVILDDGNYHYTMTLLADAASVGELSDVWQNILASVRVNIAP